MMDNILKKWQDYIKMGIRCFGISNIDESEKHFISSYIEAEKLGYPVVIAFSLRLLAMAQLKKNKFDKAEAGFKKALNICTELQNNKGISEAKAGLGSVCFLKGNFEKAEKYYMEAITIYPSDASALRLSMLYTDIGQVYKRLNNWKKAEQAVNSALQICRKYCYIPGEGEITILLGEIVYSQGNIKSAKRNFCEACRLFAKIGDENSLANATQYLAFVLFEDKKYNDALLYIHRSIVLFIKNNKPKELSESYYILSNILQHTRFLDEAQSSIELSMNYFSGSEFGYAVRYQLLAVIAIMKKEYQYAKYYYLRALKFFEYFGDSPKIGEICEELTFLIRYEKIYLEDNAYNWLILRDNCLNKYRLEIIIGLSNKLKEKGKDIMALKCAWKALEYAQKLNYKTEETENLIQIMSERIRKKPDKN
ncbi:MAG: tetratricopeptide repeat protein [Eubacteriales bacterium]